MGAETVVRPLFLAAGEGEAAPAFLYTEKDRPVDPVIWGNEERMKRELMAWAKAVASMVLSVSSPAPAPSMGNGRKCAS